MTFRTIDRRSFLLAGFGAAAISSRALAGDNGIQNQIESDFATLLFVKSAFRVKMTVEVDAGRMCRDMQKDSLYLFHVVPWSNDYHRFTSKATIDGKEMVQSADIERLHRPVYFGVIHPDGGIAKLTYEVTVYEREIGPNDKQPSPVELSPEDFKRYTDSSWNILAHRPDFDLRMEQEGLQRHDGEKPWDYMVRAARYSRERHFSGTLRFQYWGDDFPQKTTHWYWKGNKRMGG